MLSGLNKSTDFGNESVNSCYLVNWSPSTTSCLKTLIKVWFGAHVDYSDISCPVCAHVIDGKLEWRAKFRFHGFAYGVNYDLWCVQSKSPKFVISKVENFEEYAMLFEGKYIDVGSDRGVTKQVELVQASGKVPVCYTFIQSGQEVLVFVDDIEEKQLRLYNVALYEEFLSHRQSHLLLIKSVPVCKFKLGLGLIAICN